MNMPNLAWCHQAMRWAREAAWAASAGEADWAGVAMASVFAAVRASAPAAPICFKNDLLVLSLHSMIGSVDAMGLWDPRSENPDLGHRDFCVVGNISGPRGEGARARPDLA